MANSDYTTDFGSIYYRVNLKHYYTNSEPIRVATDLIPMSIQGYWIPGKAICSLPKGITPRYLQLISTEGDDLRVPIPFSPDSLLWNPMLLEVQTNSLITNAQTIGEKIDPYRVSLLAA